MISEHQRQVRQSFIGSSDSAAILSVDPYRSAADVWLEKTGRAAGFDGNQATERGNYLEPAIIAWAEDQLKVDLDRDVMLVHPNGILSCNLDARYEGETPFIVEAKSTVVAEEWGEPGTDEVPEKVLVQTHHQLAVAGEQYRVAYVPVIIAGFRSFDFRMYRVDRDDTLLAEVVNAAVKFHNDYIKADVMPNNFRPSLDVLKRVYRIPSKTVPVEDRLVTAFTAAQAIAKKATENLEDAKAALLAHFQDGDAAEFSGGLVTYFETKRSGYTVQPTTYRTLRVKNVKPLPSPNKPAELIGA